MDTSRIGSPEVDTGIQLRNRAPVSGYHDPGPGIQLEPWRVSLAGGIWLLLLYSLSVAFVVGSGGSRSNNLLGFWTLVLPAFESETSRGIAAGFPLAFLYGLGGAWLFALIYNHLPARPRAEPERP